MNVWKSALRFLRFRRNLSDSTFWRANKMQRSYPTIPKPAKTSRNELKSQPLTQSRVNSPSAPTHRPIRNPIRAARASSRTVSMSRRASDNGFKGQQWLLYTNQAPSTLFIQTRAIKYVSVCVCVCVFRIKINWLSATVLSLSQVETFDNKREKEARFFRAQKQNKWAVFSARNPLIAERCCVCDWAWIMWIWLVEKVTLWKIVYN